jgi:hypothetical protein
VRLPSIEDSTFSSLKKLRVLDLRNNSLGQLQQSALTAPLALQQVYLSGKCMLTQRSEKLTVTQLQQSALAAPLALQQVYLSGKCMLTQRSEKLTVTQPLKIFPSCTETEILLACY